MEKGFVVWFTGLPGSGKTTIAEALMSRLREAGYKVELLDGDWVRRTINPDAGFTREQRRVHLHRVAWVARLLARNGVITLCSFVSPYRDVRSEVRKIVEEEAPFVEVYVKCSLEECIRRDPKGMYKQALAGVVKNFTGIDDPYEEPENPEVTIDTEHDSVEENTNKVLAKLKDLGLVSDTGRSGMEERGKVSIQIPRELYEKVVKFIKESGGFSSVEEFVEYLINEVLSEESSEEYALSKEEEEEVKRRLKALGYI